MNFNCERKWEFTLRYDRNQNKNRNALQGVGQWNPELSFPCTSSACHNITYFRSASIEQFLIMRTYIVPLSYKHICKTLVIITVHVAPAVYKMSINRVERCMSGIRPW